MQTDSRLRASADVATPMAIAITGDGHQACDASVIPDRALLPLPKPQKHVGSRCLDQAGLLRPLNRYLITGTSVYSE